MVRAFVLFILILFCEYTYASKCSKVLNIENLLNNEITLHLTIEVFNKFYEDEIKQDFGASKNDTVLVAPNSKLKHQFSFGCLVRSLYRIDIHYSIGDSLERKMVEKDFILIE